MSGSSPCGIRECARPVGTAGSTMNGQAITFDFHNTLAACPEWFELEVRRLPSSFLRWWSERDGRVTGSRTARGGGRPLSSAAHGNHRPWERADRRSMPGHRLQRYAAPGVRSRSADAASSTYARGAGRRDADSGRGGDGAGDSSRRRADRHRLQRCVSPVPGVDPGIVRDSGRVSASS